MYCHVEASLASLVSCRVVNTSLYFTAFIILHLTGITEVSVAQIVTLIMCCTRLQVSKNKTANCVLYKTIQISKNKIVNCV